MKSEIKKIIKEIYFDRNYELYRGKIKEKISYLTEFEELLQQHDLEVIHHTLLDLPEDTWYLKYKPFQNNKHELKYKSVVRISRIFPAFNISHEFEMAHLNPKKIEPKLIGFDGQPYTFEQADMEEVIHNYFNDKGFINLSYSDMEEVIPNLPVPDAEGIFGRQMTIDNALFHDLYNISAEENMDMEVKDDEDSFVLISKSEFEELKAFRKWKKEQEALKEVGF